MDETGSKDCEDNTGEKLQEEAVEPHVEREQGHVYDLSEENEIKMSKAPPWFSLPPACREWHKTHHPSASGETQSVWTAGLVWLAAGAPLRVGFRDAVYALQLLTKP